MDSLSRRNFLTRLKYFWAPMVLSGGAAYGYGAEVERHRLKVESHDLPLALGPQGPESLRIVALSDFHYDPLYETEFIAECVRRTNELKPDLVMLMGDFVTHSSKRMGDLAEVLGRLAPAHGIFSCLGNHDHWNSNPARVVEALADADIELLTNQHSRIQVRGGELVIAGVDSIWSGNPQWPATVRGMRPQDRVIALMHEPDYAQVLSEDSRLVFQLSGHTHGGQVRLPGIGALRLPSYGHLYQEGFYNVRRAKVYVNRGIGTIGVHVRFLCPPEISCFDVTNTDRRSVS